MILKAYSGYYYDENKLLKSSSGGLATAISEGIILSDGCVYGVTYADDFRPAHYMCADDLSGLDRLKGSKYVQADKRVRIGGGGYSLFKEVCDKLLTGKTILVIGLPCEIAAIISYLSVRNVDTSNLYLCDLICHGATSQIIAEQYIRDIERKYKSKTIDFSVRYKKEGWVPSYLRAVFSNGIVYTERFYDTDYGIAFSQFAKPSCYRCKFKGENHVSDITIGDHWGLKSDSVEYNANGVSIAFVRTEKGQKLLEYLHGFKITETDLESALNHNRMYSESRAYNEKQYIRFQNDLYSKGLKYACWRTLPFKEKIKRVIPKQLLKLAYRVLKMKHA